MALTVDEINVILGADTSGFNQGMGEAQGALGRLRGSMKDAEGASSAVAGVVAGVGAALIAFGAASIKMAGDMEQTKIGFTTLLGSGQKADEFLKGLANFAAKTPFELKGLQLSSKQLLAFGFQAEEIIPIMTNVGDAVSALGGGAEEIDSVITALGQMKAKGKVSAEEMGQIAEKGIPVWDMLAKSIGVTVPEAMDMASSGAIDAAKGINGILAGMGAKFGGSMDAQSKSLNGMFSNVQDNVGQIMTTLGGQLIESLDLKPIVQGVIDVTSRFRELLTETGSLGEALKQMIPENMQAAIAIIGGAILGMLVPAFIALGTAIYAAMIPLLPFIAIGMVLGALAFIIYKKWSKIQEVFGIVVTALTSAWNYVTAFVAGVGAGLTGLWESITTGITNFGAMLVAGWNAMWAMVGAGFDAAVAFIINAWNGFMVFLGSIPGLVATFFAQLPYLAGYYLGLMIKFFMDLPGNIATILTQMGTFISTTFTNILTTASTIAGNIVTAVVTFFSQLPGKILAVLTAVKNFVVTKWTEIKTTATTSASNLVTSVVSFISQLPGKVWGFLSDTASKATTAAKNLVSGVTDFISGLPGKFTEIFNKILSYVTGLPGKLYEKAKSIGSDFWSGFKKGLGIGSPSYIERAFVAIGDQAANTVDDLYSLAPRMQSAAKDIWGGFRTGFGIGSPSLIEKAFIAVGDQANMTATQLKSVVPKFKDVASLIAGTMGTFGAGIVDYTSLEAGKDQIGMYAKQLELFRLQNRLSTDSVQYMTEKISVLGMQQGMASVKIGELKASLERLGAAGKTNTLEFMKTQTELLDMRLAYEQFGATIDETSSKLKSGNANWVKVTNNVSTLAKTVKTATKGTAFGTKATEIVAATKSAFKELSGTKVGMMIQGSAMIGAPTGTTTGVGTSRSADQSKETVYAPITVQQIIVRKESDIEAIARALFKLQQNQLRARGVTP